VAVVLAAERLRQLVVRYSFSVELFSVFERQNFVRAQMSKETNIKNKLHGGCVHQSKCSARTRLQIGPSPKFEKKGAGTMATYRDPVRCFAPLEVIERLLEIRVEAGYSPAVYLLSPDDLADYLDAYGFDVYALSEAEAEFHFGDYRAPLAPGGDHAHCSLTAH
jgi:hypothetical protein